MKPRQSLPRQWLILAPPFGDSVWRMVGMLPRDSGILLLACDYSLRQRQGLTRKLRRIARHKGLILVDNGSGDVVRVHDLRELRAALLRRTPLILLSPIYPTTSHPDWAPLPRMQAAAMARLARRRLVALGGMDERRFRRASRLGFSGWAGISAFRT